RIPEICRERAGVCAVAVDEFINQPPLDFPQAMRDRLTATAERRGYPHQAIYSYAGHDARHAAKLCPTGMIFIPCRRGISHNEAESAEPEHVAAAAQVIADILVDLANGP